MTNFRPWIDGRIPERDKPGRLLAEGRANVEVVFLELVGSSSGRVEYPVESGNYVVSSLAEGVYSIGAICPGVLGSDGRVAMVYPPLFLGDDPFIVGEGGAALIDTELEKAREELEEALEEAAEEIEAAGERIDEVIVEMGEEKERVDGELAALEAMDVTLGESLETLAAEAVVGTIVEYAVGLSETVPPEEGWSTVTPVRVPGSFIWMRSVISYGGGDVVTTSPVLLTGNAGDPGQPGQPGEPGPAGDSGVSVTAITPFFRTGGTKPSEPTGSDPTGWTKTEPAYVVDTKLWRSERIDFSNSTFSWTPVRESSSWGAASHVANLDALARENMVRVQKTQPTGTIPKGTVWWKTGDAGQLVGLYYYTGTSWVPYVLVANDLLVPGSIKAGLIDVDDLVAATAFIERLYANRVLVTPGNLLPDPTFSNPIFWSNSTRVKPTGGETGGGSFLIEAGTTQRGTYTGISDATMVYNPQVVPGRKYKVRTRFKGATAATGTGRKVSLFMRWYTEEGVTVGSPRRCADIAVFAANTWTTLEGETPTACPEGASRLSIGLYVEAAYTGEVRFSSPSVSEMTGSVLLENGTVTADKVVADSAFFKKLAVNGTLWAELITTANVRVTNDLIANTISGKSITGSTFTQAKDTDTQVSIKNGIIDLTGSGGGRLYGATTISGGEISVFNTFSTELLTSLQNFGLYCFNDSGVYGFNWENTPESLRLTYGPSLWGYNGKFQGSIWFDSQAGDTGTANIRRRTSDGRIMLASSLSKLKLDQQPVSYNQAERILNLPIIDWFDKGEREFYEEAVRQMGEYSQGKRDEPPEYGVPSVPRRIPGVTAESVRDAGLETFCTYDNDGELLGVAYDRLPLLLIPLVKELREEVSLLRTRIEELEHNG